MLIKFLEKWVLPVSVLSLLFTMPFNLEAQTTNLYGETNTKWPGIKLKISDIVRTDATHIVVVLRLEADATAPHRTFIGDPPKAGFAGAGTERRDIWKYEAIPYSLALSKLVDETTRQEFSAEARSPEGFAANCIATNLSRNSWAQMAVLLNVPPPQPAGPDGKIPPQLATILLPKATRPIEHVVLPLPTPAPTATPTTPPPSTAAKPAGTQSPSNPNLR